MYNNVISEMGKQLNNKCTNDKSETIEPLMPPFECKVKVKVCMRGRARVRLFVFGCMENVSNMPTSVLYIDHLISSVVSARYPYPLS